MKRRTFLGAAAAVSVSMVAGCQDDTEDMINQSREELEEEGELEDGESDEADDDEDGDSE